MNLSVGDHGSYKHTVKRAQFGEEVRHVYCSCGVELDDSFPSFVGTSLTTSATTQTTNSDGGLAFRERVEDYKIKTCQGRSSPWGDAILYSRMQCGSYANFLHRVNHNPHRMIM